MCDGSCDCEEERERQDRARAVARARKLEALRIAGETAEERRDALIAAGVLGPDGRPPRPKYSVGQIVFGSWGFLVAFTAFLLKTGLIDNDKFRDRTHFVLSKVGLGHLVPPTPKKDPGHCDGLRINPAKRKYPLKDPPRKQCICDF